MPAKETGPPVGPGRPANSGPTGEPTGSRIAQSADNARRRRAIVRTETTKHSAYFHGPVRVIAPAIRTVGCVSQYSPTRRAFCVPVRFADEVAVAIETGPYPVRIEQLLGWSQ